jgi:hypothetical protein
VNLSTSPYRTPIITALVPRIGPLPPHLLLHPGGTTKSTVAPGHANESWESIIEGTVGSELSPSELGVGSDGSDTARLDPAVLL